MMNTTRTAPDSLEVPLRALAELAVVQWRLAQWLAKLDQPESAAHARHASRQLGRFLTERELSVLDLSGQPYHPGLAVEVLDVVSDEEMPSGAEVIDEMVAPVVAWRGMMVQFGQVIVRRGERETEE